MLQYCLPEHKPPCLKLLTAAYDISITVVSVVVGEGFSVCAYDAGHLRID